MVKCAVLRRVVAGLLLLALAGCGGDKPATPVAAKTPVTAAGAAVQSLVGQWQVVSFGRKPLPAGVTITVTYQDSGEVAVDAVGEPASIPAIDPHRLKREMDNFAKNSAGIRPDTMKFEESASNGKSSVLYACELRRK